MFYADVAQLAEQLICNQQVIGSSPIIGFLKWMGSRVAKGGRLEICCVSLRWFESTSIHYYFYNNGCIFPEIVYNNRVRISAGWSSLEARRAHNPKVAGSNPAPAIFLCNEKCGLQNIGVKNMLA